MIPTGQPHGLPGGAPEPSTALALRRPEHAEPPAGMPFGWWVAVTILSSSAALVVLQAARAKIGPPVPDEPRLPPTTGQKWWWTAGGVAFGGIVALVYVIAHPPRLRE